MIKFLDLKYVSHKYKHDFLKLTERVIDSGRFIQGEELDNFELMKLFSISFICMLPVTFSK